MFKDFLIRRFPSDLHSQVKDRARGEGISMRVWIINAIRAALAR